MLLTDSDCLQCLEHIAVGRTGGVQSDSLAAQVFEPRNLGIRHEHIVADKVILRRAEKPIAATRD